MEVRIFTIKNCNFCQQAKDFLNKKGIAYKEFDMSIGGNPELQKMKIMFKAAGLKTYPVTLIKDKEQIILQGFVEQEYIDTFGGE